MATELSELPLVLPKTAAEINRAVELMSRKINEIIRTTKFYLDDVTQLDSIPGTLNGSKIYGSVGVDTPLDELFSFEATFGTLFVNSVEPNTSLLSPLSGAGINFVNLNPANAPLAGIPLGVPVSVHLDADMVDGQHGPFAAASHVHAGTDITSGLLPDARLSTNIPRFSPSPIFTLGLTAQRTNTTDVALRASTTAGGAAYEVLAGGNTLWGNPGSARDLRLRRSAAAEMTIDNNAGGAAKLHLLGELELDGALNHDGASVGFYGVAPVARPSLTYSRTGESVPEAAFRAALSSLGLVSDDTVP